MNLEAINNRILEIRSLLESDQDINLNELEKELRELNENKAAMEKRAALLQEAQAINVMATETRAIEKFNATETREVGGLDSLEYRNAFMKYVLTGQESPELRADAITKTTDVGAVIPNTILNRIVEKLESVGNIL